MMTCGWGEPYAGYGSDKPRSIGGNSGETVGGSLGAALGDGAGPGALDALAGAGLGPGAKMATESSSVSIIARCDSRKIQRCFSSRGPVKKNDVA